MPRHVTLCLLAILGAGCSDADPLPPYVPEAGPLGLRAVGNRVEDAEGRHVILRGVNRSGTEYQCTKDFGDGMIRHFDGPSDEESIDAITSWPGVNAVRVPLNDLRRAAPPLARPAAGGLPGLELERVRHVQPSRRHDAREPLVPHHGLPERHSERRLRAGLFRPPQRHDAVRATRRTSPLQRGPNPAS